MPCETFLKVCQRVAREDDGLVAHREINVFVHEGCVHLYSTELSRPDDDEESSDALVLSEEELDRVIEALLAAREEISHDA